MNSGHIYFILGVSGAGKGTLIQNIKNLNISGIHIPLSYKTRAMRKTEINGKDAWFVSRAEFFSGVQNGEFLEYALVHDLDYYGTKYEDVIEHGIFQGKIVIKELDILGLQDLRKSNPELDESYTTIFLNIPESTLKERIAQRGAFMSDEELEKRLKSAIFEEQHARSLCDYMIDATQSPEKVLEEVLKIIKRRGKSI